MKLVINKLCSECNEDFELKKVSHNRNTKSSIANFENCPHCGARNDHWIEVKWPELSKQTKA
jgi:uncharacterized protein with PIN domain